MASASESGVPQTDVSRPSALPTARLRQHHSQPVIDQASNEYLDGIEEEWNRRVDVEIETLVDGMADIVSLASVRAHHISRAASLLNASLDGCGVRGVLWDRLATRTSSASHRRRSRRSAARSPWCVRLPLVASYALLHL